jgi:hypothetical protein
MMVSRRRKLLDYLHEKDADRYVAITKKTETEKVILPDENGLEVQVDFRMRVDAAPYKVLSAAILFLRISNNEYPPNQADYV